jgi:SAM-dependent methyltransferase
MTRRARYVNSSRVHLGARMRAFARDTEQGMLVLDAGAGRSPYRKLFAHARYEAADFAQLGTDYAPLDYVCDLSEIPVEDERYDRIVLNQVLEHLPAPRRVLAELHRVLKPGGLILCSCPLYFPEHQRPYDYYRYTQYALRMLFEGAGFDIRSLDWLEGYFGTVAYQLHLMHRDLPRSARTLTSGWRRLYLQPLLTLTRLMSRPLAVGFSRADVRWHYEGGGMPKNYVLLAQKPLPRRPAV